MPATPSQLRRPVVVAHTVTFGDGVDVTFQFDRNKITDAWLQEWSRLEEERNTSAINEMLVDLVVSWDVVNDDGSPYPLTAEAIGFLFTLPDKGRLVQELMRASVPSESEGKASSVPGSTPSLDSVPLPQTPQNGHTPSPSPEPSASPSTT